MSKQSTVPCPVCKGAGGETVESAREAVDNNGETITVYGERWQPCAGPCGGSGQIVGGN